MRARLFTRVGEMAGAEFRIGERAVVGRAQDCDVVLPAATISGQHARIQWDPQRGSYVLEDLGSSNGTRLDGVPVSEPERLLRLHVLSFADDVDLIFQDLSDVDEEVVGEGPPAGAAQALAGTRPAAQRGHRLVLDEPHHGVRELRLQEGENEVGRSADSSIRLDSRDVSRRHAVLRLEQGRVRVRDLGSANHTFLNGVQLEPEQDVDVPVGARLGFAGVEATLSQADD